jgi:hypothetical protein
MNIPLSVSGRILNSQKDEHFVRVEDDAESTGGFLIFEHWKGSDGPNVDGGFDNWVADQDTLERFFLESGWKVVWPAA